MHKTCAIVELLLAKSQFSTLLFIFLYNSTVFIGLAITHLRKQFRICIMLHSGAVLCVLSTERSRGIPCCALKLLTNYPTVSGWGSCDCVPGWLYLRLRRRSVSAGIPLWIMSAGGLKSKRRSLRNCSTYTKLCQVVENDKQKAIYLR